MGCILFAGAAKSLGARDRWIGWTYERRLRNLAWVINKSRFLIFLCLLPQYPTEKANTKLWKKKRKLAWKQLLNRGSERGSLCPGGHTTVTGPPEGPYRSRTVPGNSPHLRPEAAGPRLRARLTVPINPSFVNADSIGKFYSGKNS